MYQKITLSNGARLLTQAVPGVRSAALGFYVGVGSRHERAEESGAAHFIEHMLFKGTGRRSAAQLARDTDAIGGQFNAYTTKEHTCFYARTLDRHLDLGLDILTDMLFHSRFDQGDVEMEREVILGEIGMYEDNPEDLVFERLSAAAYQDSPLARPILGRESTLSGMTGEWLRQWQRERYHAGTLVAALVGSFTDRQVELLTRTLAQLPRGEEAGTAPSAYRPAVTARKKAIEQNHLLLAYPAPTYLDERRPQAALLNALLGGGCSSRLFQELREARGLCYSTYSTIDNHADTGLIAIYAAVSPERERDALDAAREIVQTLAEHGPGQEELERVREQAKANLLLSTESVQNRMNQLGGQTTLYGQVLEVDELLERYDAVTREQVRELAQEMFRPDMASLSAVGQVGEPEDYARWLGMSS